MKKFFKVIFIVLLICLAVFCLFRYNELKKSGKLGEVFSKTKENTNFIDNYEDYANSKETATDAIKKQKEESKEEIKEEVKKDGEGYVVEEKNYDDYYNKYNFDNVLLLYGGKQDFGAMKEVMERMVLTSEDPLYSKPTVVFNNFSGLSSNTITYENREQYVNVLKQARDGLTDGFYKIEFDYTKLNAQVNKVIITKL